MEEQIMKCLQCGGDMTSGPEDVEYGDSGLPNVTLLGVGVSRCSVCGEFEVEIPRIEELHRAIALAVASTRARLSGIEVKFLRKYLGYSSKDFASTIGVSQETVSRWENDKETIGPLADRLLRLMVFRQRPLDEYPTEKLADVAQEPPRKPKIYVRSIKDIWQAQSVA
jgi:putative zinc finger/helix-turn-helix YgiT family protein